MFTARDLLGRNGRGERRILGIGEESRKPSLLIRSDPFPEDLPL